MPAQAVIINADDLGLWPSVNRGIFDAWRDGAISDSTVFANAAGLPDLLARAAAAHLPVGLHLNLTHGAPLCDPAEIPALVTADGLFMKRQQWTLPLPVDQVRRELSRQVAHLYALGWFPSHLDSHHHIHRYPEVLAVVMELALEQHLPVRSVDDAMRLTLREAGIVTPDAFIMSFYGETATTATLSEAVERCSGGVLEVMTHPGYSDPALSSSYREARAQELVVLNDPTWQAYRAAHGVILMGFGELSG